MSTLLWLAAGALGQGATVSIEDDACGDLQIDPGIAVATLAFRANGTFEGGGNVQNFTGNWITPTGAAGSNYEIRATVSSGDTPAGTIGTWESLGADREWDQTFGGMAGEATCELLIEIRRASSGVVLDSATYTMTATVTT